MIPELGSASWEALWQAAILGVVQGVTEFLPVSSTGHLILVPALFGWRDSIVNQLEFDVALHIGTLVALLGVFWRDWASLALAGGRSLRDSSLADGQARLAWLVALATAPAAAAGVLFQRQVETVARAPLVVSVAMVSVGIILAVVDRAASRSRDEYSLGPVAALAVGLGQALALVPGVSRSGSTIAVGLAAGLTRVAAARFSFLLSTPIVFGAVAKQSFAVVERGVAPGDAAAFAVGILAAALSGYACIRLFLAYLGNRSLVPFVVYRIVAGSIIMALSATGRLL